MNNSVNFTNFLDFQYDEDQETETVDINSHLEEYLQHKTNLEPSTDKYKVPDS